MLERLRGPVFRLLPELTNQHLSTLLKSIGAKTTGTKPDLITRATTELLSPHLEGAEASERILSIDMGVKNLAFCACDVTWLPTTPAASATTNKELQHPLRPRIDVQEWRTVSLMDPGPASSDAAESPEDTYHPRNMSRVALDFVHTHWLPLKPSRVLIERQRFRTARSPQVQEWTVRVNMLESILYAIFAATSRIKGAQDGVPAGLLAVEGVSPARVAAFWADDFGAGAVAESKGPAGARAVKREKVELVRRWARESGSAPFELGFPGASAERMRRLLAEGKTRRQKARNVSDTDEVPAEPAKMDDLADCLLQAAAWVQWEMNRRFIEGSHPQNVQELRHLLDSLRHRMQDIC